MTRVLYLALLTALFLSGLVALVSCGGSPQPATPPTPQTGTQVRPEPPVTPPGPGITPAPSAVAVEIASFAFSPATITVPAGTTVTWTNNDSAPHTVTTRTPLFDSGSLSRGETFSYTFAQAGAYEYYCAIHPRMTAVVIVE
ncbi:MAG TPA: cupredoxin family copper-binding protein [Dehalococcoidales bacterium]|nr:cupredoxin family copper-binding protein [Dehalococcoidales bacterium]